MTTPWGKHYYYPHSIHVEIEAQNRLLKVTQIISGWARIQTWQSEFRVLTLDHYITLPLRWDAYSVSWNSTLIHSFLWHHKNLWSFRAPLGNRVSSQRENPHTQCRGCSSSLECFPYSSLSGELLVISQDLARMSLSPHNKVSQKPWRAISPHLWHRPCLHFTIIALYTCLFFGHQPMTFSIVETLFQTLC